MIHFSFLLLTFFQPEYFGNNASYTFEIFLTDREVNNCGKIFKKCKSFDVAYLPHRIELHLSWAFLNEFFNTLYFLNNFCKIVHF